MKKSLLQYTAFLPLFLLCGYYLCKAIAFPVHDFANYYFGGQFLAAGHFNSTIYFPYKFNKAIFDLGYSGIFASYAPNTPFLAVLFTPFALLTVAKAKLLFNVFSTVLFILSIYRLFSYYKLSPKYALLIPILFLVPIKNNLLFGQVYLVLFFLLTEGWLAYEKKQWIKMSIFWSFAILLKVFPVLLVALLLFKKQWKPLSYLILCCLSLFGISLLFTGFDIWLFYLKEVLPKASRGEIATSFVDNYQSVFMFLKRLFIYDTIENPHPLFHADSGFTAGILAFKVSGFFLGFFISKTISNSFIAFSFLILAMLMLSPYGSTYTLILLALPLFALLNSNISNVKKGILCLLLFLINNYPLVLFIEKPFPFSYLRLLFLIAFALSFVMFQFKKSVLIKTILLGSVVLVIARFVITPTSGKGDSVLAAGSPILIYNYEIEQNQLTYFYWNEKGENKVIIPFEYKSCESIGANDKHLAFDKNNKLKPVLINGKTIYYLSDLNRGIGFFTLRKIDLP